MQIYKNKENEIKKMKYSFTNFNILNLIKKTKKQYFFKK